MTDLTPDQLAADKKLAEEATPGPYYIDALDGDLCGPGGQRVSGLRNAAGDDDTSAEDRAFFTRFNPKTALAYIAALEESRAKLAKAREALEEAGRAVLKRAQHTTIGYLIDRALAQLGEKGAEPTHD